MPKPCPDEYCAKCRAPGYGHGNHKCGRPFGNGETCSGSTRSANNVGDWKECPQCGGEGCDACHDSGWVLLRT